jgi:hypothetical protein
MLLSESVVGEPDRSVSVQPRARPRAALSSALIPVEVAPAAAGIIRQIRLRRPFGLTGDPFPSALTVAALVAAMNQIVAGSLLDPAAGGRHRVAAVPHQMLAARTREPCAHDREKLR